MLATASSSRVGTLCGHFANFLFTRLDGAVLEYGRFGVGLGGGLARVVVGDGGGEDGAGLDRAVDEEGVVVECLRQQRRRCQKQVTPLLRQGVGPRREWFPAPARRRRR